MTKKIYNSGSRGILYLLKPAPDLVPFVVMQFFKQFFCRITAGNKSKVDKPCTFWEVTAGKRAFGRGPKLVCLHAEFCGASFAVLTHWATAW